MKTRGPDGRHDLRPSAVTEQRPGSGSK